MTSSDSGKSYWERHARRYDRSVRLLSKQLPRMLELTAEATRGAAKVLEVAAGTGLLTPSIARSAKHVVATDYADAMIAMLRERVSREGLRNVTCEQADLYALPYDAGAFDTVVAANVLHVVPDLTGAVAAMKRVLKPGGLLVVPTFVHDETLLSGTVSRLLALTGFPGKRRFTARSLRDELERAELHVMRQEVLRGVLPICFIACSSR